MFDNVAVASVPGMGSRVKNDVARLTAAPENIGSKLGALAVTIEAIEHGIWSLFAKTIKAPRYEVSALSAKEGISLAQASDCIRLMAAANSRIDCRTKQEIQEVLDDFNDLKNSAAFAQATPTSAAQQFELLHTARTIKASLDACCMVLISGFKWEQLNR
ncbi:hypothetical protein [Pseudomonas sp. DP-17]|uniref:hypothetical protein n=1 Tax=Pseudomonas sp. DP-17 TaxID=1580486 RepID=UPI001EFBAA3B|nr:hypothetical protein [Pseudomonas sp. DP-17]MCG8907308.1 hypothetical protein [Pseudomonas sp. DP-17]